MKKIVSVIAAALIAGTALGASACGGKVDSSNPQTLEVYVCNLGYGYSWAEKMLNDFAEEAWVKEKYPDLQVSFSQDAVEQNSKNWLENNSTNYDVIMCTNLEAYLGESEGKTADLTELVYHQTVPGENVTFEDKMFDSVRESNRDVNSTAEDPRYYTATFASGMTGIAYNATVLEKLGFEEPNTTDELFAIAESIRTGTYVEGARGSYTAGAALDRSVYSSESAFVTYGVSAYINYTVETWWAQYEGVDNYINYFQGMSDGVLSSAVTRQTGRLKALEATEEMMEYTRLYPSAERDAYRRAQNEVVMGQSLFMANGDWFDLEERDFATSAPGAGEVRLMNAPVLSSIRDKAPSIPDDAALALVIEAIDNGCTSISEAEAQFPELKGKNITDADFGTVYDARMVVYSIGPRHNIVIPECSPAKEVAADFILYMATDKCLETYASETGGASLPFDYDYEQNETLWNSFSAMQKQRLQLFTQPDLNIMPNAVKYPLVLRGGFSAWTPCDNPGYEIQINGSSAQDIYDEVIQYWTENNSSRFNVACSQAGITG